MKQTISYLTTKGLRSVFIACLFVLALLQTNAAQAASGEYTYREIIEQKPSLFSWSLEQKRDRAIVTKKGEVKSSQSVALTGGNTVEWTMQNTLRGYDVKGVRTNNMLEITGTKKGKNYRMSAALGGKPWFQHPEHSLLPFLRSPGTNISFWTVVIDDLYNLKVLELEAVKIGEEYITDRGKQVATKRIEVRAVGYLNKFWHDIYWIRKTDEQLIKYQSIHGFPGQATTVIELVSEPSK